MRKPFFVLLLVACSPVPAPPPDSTPTLPAPVSAPVPAPVPAATRPAVAGIDIEDAWQGLGQHQAVRVHLAATASGYTLQGTASRDRVETPIAPRTVPLAAVDAFVSAALAPPMHRQDLLAELTRAEWLQAHAGPAFEPIAAVQNEPCHPAARKLFVARFEDASVARAALEAHFGSRHTDDYPETRVTIGFADGTSRSLTSSSQSPWMLPWRLPEGESWDPAIARTLAALLPAEAPNTVALVRSPQDVIGEAIREGIDLDRWEDACRRGR